MNNSEDTLIKLLDAIRKDAGVNNAIDAMEQLSLILLVKYFYDAQFLDSTNPRQITCFKDLFFKQNDLNPSIIEKNGFNLRDVFIHVVDDLKTSFNTVNYINDVAGNWKLVESLFDVTPFKIRSIKTLEILLYELEQLVLNESLADDYDRLVVKMINDSLSAGAFHSPKALITSIVKVVKPALGKSIYDPAMGTARFLIEAKKLISRDSESSLNISYEAYGKDISAFACLVGTLNLLLNGISIKNISLTDSLLSADNQRYDIILCGAPFGKPPNLDTYKYIDILSTSSLEAMFLEHCMRVLSTGGKAALIVPDGLLFNRNNDLIELRHKLLTMFNLHTILSLPSGVLAPASGVKVSVLFFDKTRSMDDIWFYQVVTQRPLNKTNPISDDDLAEFTDLFLKRIDSAQSRLVSKHEVLSKEDYSLALQLSKTAEKKSYLNVFEEVISLQQKKEDIDLLFLNLIESLREDRKSQLSNKVTIGKLFSARAGKALNSSEILEKGPYPVYGGNGLRGFFDKYNRVGESIIIGRVGANCGNVHLAKGNFWITNNALSLELKSTQDAFVPYLVHVLRSLNLNNLARGAAMPSISFSNIQDIEIFLPSYEQQVALSNWFEALEQNSLNLQKEFDAQKQKIKELTEHAILSNCIKST